MSIVISKKTIRFLTLLFLVLGIVFYNHAIGFVKTSIVYADECRESSRVVSETCTGATLIRETETTTCKVVEENLYPVTTRDSDQVPNAPACVGNAPQAGSDTQRGCILSRRYPECRGGITYEVRVYSNCDTESDNTGQACGGAPANSGGNSSGGANSGGSGAVCETYPQCGGSGYPPTTLITVDYHCDGTYTERNQVPNGCDINGTPAPTGGAGGSGTQGGGNPTTCSYEQKSEQYDCVNGHPCYNDYYRDSSTNCEWAPKTPRFHCDENRSCNGGAGGADAQGVTSGNSGENGNNTCDQNECKQRYGVGAYCSNGVCNPPVITNTCDNDCRHRYGLGAGCNARGECVPPAFESACSQERCVHLYGPGSYCSPNGKTCIPPSISGPRGNNQPVPGGIDCGGGCNKIRNICLAAYYTSHPVEALNSGAAQICQVKKDRLTQIGQNFCYFLETNIVSQAKAQCDLQWEGCMSSCK